MTLADPDQTALLGLVLAVAPLMPSEGAVRHVALEWRIARARWLASVERLGFTEDQARAAAAAAFHHSWREAVEAEVRS